MKNSLVFLIILFGVLTLKNHAQQNEKIPVTSKMLESISSPSEIKLSPNGKLIAFCLKGEIIIHDIEGNHSEKINKGYGITWSKSGRELAFIALDSNSGKPQVYSYTIKDKKHKQITNLDSGISGSSLGWSMNNRIVFTSNIAVDLKPLSTIKKPEPASIENGTPMVLDNSSPDGYAAIGILPGAEDPDLRLPESLNQLFIHDLKTNKTNQLTHDNEDYSGAKWSPDGNSILCVSRAINQKDISTINSSIKIIDINTKSSLEIAPSGDGINKVNPKWSPNGNYISYMGYSFTDSRENSITIVKLNESKKVLENNHDDNTQNIISLKGSYYNYLWDKSSKSIYAIRNVKSVFQPILKINIHTKKEAIIASENAVVFNLTKSKNGRLSWIESNGKNPAVLKFKKTHASDPIQIYDFNPEIKYWNLGEQEVVHWKNKAGHERYGILIKPINYESHKRYPLVVSAYSQTSHVNTFQKETHAGFANQEFASKGYAVFFPGPRLPWMYGSVNSPEVKGPKGWNVTVDDIESGVDLLIEKGIVDPDRMSIIGFSNGGAAATATITLSNRYKAAVIIAPANLNWIHSAIYTDDTSNRYIPTKTFMGIDQDFSKNQLDYLHGSIVFKSDLIETPTLLAIGENDQSSFILPTLQLFLTLRDKGVETTFLRYPNIGHWFYGKAGADLYERTIAFIDSKIGNQ